MNGNDLLAEFGRTRSEEAFGELVRRYTNLVYSIAKRRLNNDSLAQDTTQMVFIRLARAVPDLHSESELLSWLHGTTLHVSIDLWRSESRRSARETKAVTMQPEQTENTAWKELAPVLDEALNEMDHADKQAILLRFFADKTMRDLGQAVGISEDAAKMRVSRALERLRTLLGVRGVTCSAVALGALLTNRTVEGAPSQLIANLAAHRFLAPAAAVTGTGILAWLWYLCKTKPVASLATALCVGTGVIMTARSLSSQVHSPVAPSNLADQSVAQGQSSNDAADPASAADTNANPTHQQAQPDPRLLLNGVAKARLRLGSGSMEFEITRYEFSRPLNGTNLTRLKVLFDDSKRRFESFAREYRCVSMEPNGAEATDAKIRELGLDHKAAEEAGLVQGFDSHHVTIYTGEADAGIIDFWQTDNVHPRTAIIDPKKGVTSFLFDPRCLGLSTYLSPNQSIETLLTYGAQTSVDLIGLESVDGIPVWHVQVRRSMTDDFWIDADHPDRVVRYSYNGDVLIAKYDEGNLNDPLPTEVIITHYRNNTPVSMRRLARSNTLYHVQLEDSYWTLAGLGMPIGTEVSDWRISQIIGYWTGGGLSDYIPKTGTSQIAPDHGMLLALLNDTPASAEALDAAQWIILNTPDGPEVQKAAEVVLQNHIRSTKLLFLCQELERLRPACAVTLLEALLDKNPQDDIRGNSCFSLAALHKARAQYGWVSQSGSFTGRALLHV